MFCSLQKYEDTLIKKSGADLKNKTREIMMKQFTKKKVQMSESAVVNLVLALSGGCMDAYSYLYRERGFCKCADREHAPVRSECRRRRFCRSHEILLAGDHIHSGDHFSGLYSEQDTGCARALAADRFSGRNPAFVRCVLDPSVAERSGEYADFAGVWYAGRDVPIFPGQRYRNHHVHR